MSARWLILILIFILGFFTVYRVEAAPITRTVDDRFEITVGFIHEPAILGDTNGIRIRITEGGEPVTGVTDSLNAQVEFMEAVRVFTLTESEPGVYTGIFIPMQAGDYSFTVSGSVDGVEINEFYIVADGISPVLERSDFEFPNVAYGTVIEQLATPLAATAIVGAALILWRKRTA